MNGLKKYLDKEGLTVLVGKILEKADKTDLTAKADKSEMSVVAGTGNNADKTTITLKSGTSAVVLTSHQDISGKANVSDIPTIPTNVSTFTNDAKYVTEDDMQVDVIDANGHEYVDLGLPSGTLWATMNVGANSVTDYGNYYQYGKGAAQYAETNGDSDYSGTEDPLDSSVDTVVQVWGGDWKMPTLAQCQELIANTTYQWVTNYQGSGVNGGTFTANGQTLFIPAAGHYDGDYLDSEGSNGNVWSSTPYGSTYAYFLYFYNNKGEVTNDNRFSCFSVRGVINASKAPKYATKAELANVATSGSYNDLSDKPTIPTIPTNVSTFTNDANYVTQDTLDDILGVDVNGLVQIKEVLSDDDTTTGLINLIGQKADAADIQTITNQEIALLFDPYRGHAYVEIAGLKWATMNIGAESITDGGLYFAWGDTQGYTADQVGSSEGQKAFTWADYKYGNGTSNPGTAGMTKYNSTDNKTVLDLDDDAANAAWGGNWRMPTAAEFQALGEATTSTWTDDYQGSGISGVVLTDKTDSSKKLFFPAYGCVYLGAVDFVGSNGNYWGSSLDSSGVTSASLSEFYNSEVDWGSSHYRYNGSPVRAVAD